MHYVELPEGWSYQRIDIPDRAHIFDDKGNIRVVIYPNDIQPSIRLNTQYFIELNPVEDRIYSARVRDSSGRTLFTSPSFVGHEDTHEDILENKVLELASNWLDKNYPDWQNPLVYWNN